MYNVLTNLNNGEKDMNRRTIRITQGLNLIRIFKSDDGKTISVYKHSHDAELSRLFGTNQTEAKGLLKATHAATGKYSYTLKEVAADY